MANTSFQLKRSSVSGRIPKGEDLAIGELAINLADGLIYTKQGNGNVIAVSGSSGVKGDKGDTGLDGISGDKGEKGDAGADGVIGVDGAKGDKGDTGDKGDPGNDGTAGDKGDKGEPGLDGTAAAKGEKGDKGDAGEKGTDGIIGVDGAKGDKGDTGVKGDTGQTGTQGDKGDTGQKGEKGETGAKGEQGVGEKGDKGELGEKGDLGTLTRYTYVTSNTTVNPLSTTVADTFGGPITITLPSSPVQGDWVKITDGYNWNVNNLTIARNGSTIEGYDEDLTMDIGNIFAELTYTGSTWIVSTTAGTKGDKGDLGNSEVDMTFGTVTVANSITINSTAYINSTGDALFNSVTLDTTPTGNTGPGKLSWNSADGTLNIGLSNTVTLQTGQEILYRVRNETGSTLENGTSVYASGVTVGSGRISVSPYAANGDIREVRFVGVVTEDIPNGINGFVTHFGYVRDLDTRGTSNTSISVGDEDWSVGDVLYCHPTVPGKLTNVKPEHEVTVAILINRHQSAGVLFVRPSSAGHLDDLHDVHIPSPSNGNILYYNGGNQRWEAGTANTAGLVGDKGEKGDKGVDGVIGVDGAKGEKGDTGEKGADGTIGIDGAKGDKGDTGADSTVPGPKGDAGETGTKGDKGDTGQKGEKGETGAKGEIGQKGDDGLIGDKGQKGETGTIASYSYVTSNTTASPFDVLIADTFNGSFDITLPSSPSQGDWVKITDGYNWDINPLTVLRNGQTIEGAAEDIVLDIGNIIAEITYTGNTWIVSTTAGTKGDKGDTDTSRVSGFVDAGTFVTMDNIRATVTSSGPRGLSLATTTGSITYNISATYGGVGGAGGTALNSQTLTTTPTSSIFGWGFSTEGEVSTYVLVDKTNSRSYRITVSIGPAYLSNMISIERLI